MLFFCDIMHVKERMKKLISIFVVMMIIAPSLSFGAVVVNKQSPVVKKAAAVEVQDSGGLGGGIQSAASLLPSVIGLVQDVQKLKKDQQQLSAGCAPSSADINTVNDLVKEWARVSDTTISSARSGLGTPTNGVPYKDCMEAQDKEGCYEIFPEKEGYAWSGFPKASSAKLSDGKDVSNVYLVLRKIPFGPDDYTQSELSKVKNLMEKANRCQPETISKQKKELWGNFLVGTIGKVGSATNTAGVSDVMGMAQTLGASGGAGGVSSVLSSFGGQALQAFDK